MTFEIQEKQQTLAPCGTRKHKGVTIGVGLSDGDEVVNPGSRVRIDVMIVIEGPKRIFDEIHVRVMEIDSWSSIMTSTCGNQDQLTEMKKLSTRNISHWTEKLDDKQRRVIDLHKISLDIPHSASCDKPKNMVRVHHFIEVKLVSKRPRSTTLRFRYPFVLGDKQYVEVPEDHPLRTSNIGNRTASDAIADTIVGVTNTIDRLMFQGPLKQLQQKRAAVAKQSKSRNLMR